jgi:hypothetical protein
VLKSRAYVTILPLIPAEAWQLLLSTRHGLPGKRHACNLGSVPLTVLQSGRRALLGSLQSMPLGGRGGLRAGKCSSMSVVLTCAPCSYRDMQGSGKELEGKPQIVFVGQFTGRAFEQCDLRFIHSTVFCRPLLQPSHKHYPSTLVAPHMLSLT